MRKCVYKACKNWTTDAYEAKIMVPIGVFKSAITMCAECTNSYHDKELNYLVANFWQVGKVIEITPIQFDMIQDLNKKYSKIRSLKHQIERSINKTGIGQEDILNTLEELVEHYTIKTIQVA